MSIWSNLGFGLMVTVIGVLVVFFGLVVLIGLIKLMEALTSNLGRKKEAPKAAPAPAAPAPVVEAAPAVSQDSDALIAVITAAVSAMLEEGSAFTVRRVRRVSNTPAWSKSGREEQVYSRF